MNLNQASEDFINHCRYNKNLSSHSIRAYESDLKVFRNFTGNINMLSCERATIKKYLAYLFDQCNLKETSIKRRIACLKSFFRWHSYEYDLDTTPFHNLDLNIKLPKRLPRSLNRTELKQLLKSPLDELGLQNRLLLSVEDLISKSIKRRGFLQLTTLLSIELLFSSGIRVNELVTIQLNDIDLSESTISIKGKGNRERQVFITDKALSNLIQAYLSIRFIYNPTHNSFIINSRGNGASTQFIRLLIKNAANKTNIERKITPHMIRHSTATHLLEAGIDIRYVQKLLGHSSISVTEIYTHVQNKTLRDLISKKHPMREIST